MTDRRRGPRASAAKSSATSGSERGTRAMSRIGKKIITIPKGVDVRSRGRTSRSRPEGDPARAAAPAVRIEVADGVLTVVKVRDEKGDDAAHGLVAQSRGEHDHRRDRRVPEGARESSGRLPRAGSGGVLTLTVGTPTGETTRSRRIDGRGLGKGQVSIKGIDKRPGRHGRLRVRAVRPPSPTRARGSSTPTSGSAARSARPAPRRVRA